jgi:hypothetical protein
MRRERSVRSRPNLELARREVAWPRPQMWGGISFAVSLFAVALRTVIQVELLARLPLRLSPDVRSRRTQESRQRGTERGDQHSNTPARQQARGHCFVASSVARGLRPVKS